MDFLKKIGLKINEETNNKINDLHFGEFYGKYDELTKIGISIYIRWRIYHSCRSCT